ncbi:phenylacetate--CoA ligase family protein [Sporolactobacillus kofuensis]|uniref:Phenylacetate--CoA ligase family protein n=1 Tax=Sporolactobacillus kofuensis TaxID=269672 RepID=A0ABW1WDL2_9BACL|nr:AMP-binding protein [Sporolactobacillus kofuensis]MCO7175986.1 AMP-binding protein [Sporolactobacillus kofuensis]
MNDLFVASALRSSFYKNKLAQRTIDSWDDIPFTTKEELRNASAYDVLGAPIEAIATYHETSGTTGTPTPSWYSHSDVTKEARVILKSQLNLRKDDILLNRFPFALAIPSFILYWACEEVGATHIGVDKASMITPDRRVVEIMQRAKPSIVAMLPSEAEKLFEVAKQLSIPFPTKGLRALFLAGELVSPKRKAYFEKLWGVPVFTFFGSTESGGLFVSDEQGYYRLNNAHVKIEVVDENKNPVPHGVRGYGVLSTMREGMPLLRYYNHDLLEIRDADPTDPDQTPILIHYGRDENTINCHGALWTFYELQELIYSLDQIPLLWKVKQEGDAITFILQYTPDQEVSSESIKNEIYKRSDLDADVLIEAIIPIEKLVGKPAYSKYVHVERV